jgi:hypothetical protein
VNIPKLHKAGKKTTSPSRQESAFKTAQGDYQVGDNRNV